MAFAAARIDKRLARLGNELPIIAARVQRQFEDTEGIRVALFAVGVDGAEGPLVFPARADHKLPNSASSIRQAIRVLHRKALVIMIVTGDHHIRIGIVERLPQRLDARIVAVRCRN